MQSAMSMQYGAGKKSEASSPLEKKAGIQTVMALNHI